MGPKLARNLIAYLGSVEAIFTGKPRFEKIPGIGEVNAARIRATDMNELLNRASKELDFARKNEVNILFFTDDNYPKRLSACEDAPLLLYTKGNASVDASKIISIVGTRRPTDHGLSLCEKFIANLALRHPGTLVVSGLAYGVDICVHRAALRNNLPTVAVLAHGLDKIYPPTHHATAREIVERGMLASEFMTGTNPDKPNFVRRNRIVAGMCDAVLVVESAVKGGALLTAGMAASYNRDVMAFPGRVGDEFSAGCNKIIKSNMAALVESVEDLEYVMGWEPRSQSDTVVQKSLFAVAESADERRIMEVLIVEKEMNINLLALQCNMPVGKVSAALLDLEFKGMVKSRPGGIFKLN